MNARSAPMWWGVAAVVVAALVVMPLAVGDDDDGAAGFDGYIQSGTCAAPSDELTIDLEGAEDAPDVEPYVAVGADGKQVTLGQYGATEAPRLQCRGDLFQPAVLDGDHGSRQRQPSRAATSCSPMPTSSGRPAWQSCSSCQSGRAASKGSRPSSGPASSGSWTSLRPELGSSSPPRTSPCRRKRPPATRATCRAGRARRRRTTSGPSRTARTTTTCRPSRPGPPRRPTPSRSPTTDRPASPASAWVPPTPSRASRWSSLDPDRTSQSRAATSCEPDDDKFTEAGLALVQLMPTGGDAGVQGYAVIDRVTMQRELDVTPTLIRIVLFAAPATAAT